MSWWLTISASAGTSFKVGMRRREYRTVVAFEVGRQSLGNEFDETPVNAGVIRKPRGRKPRLFASGRAL